MLSHIEYVLPAGNEGKASFAALQMLLGGSGDSVVLPPSATMKPDIVFKVDENRQAATILVHTPEITRELPPSFFPVRTASSSRLTLVEAAKRLTGKVKGVDHIALAVPCDMSFSAWTEAVNFLAANSAMYDYPRGTDGYSPEKRWLYIVPATEQEVTNGLKPNQLREPKFAMFSEANNNDSKVAFVLRTELTREQIIERFPGDESFDIIPELASFFRSIKTPSPWPGIEHIQFNLGYVKQGPEKIDPWNSGDFFVQGGTRVLPNGPATKLPQQNCG